MDDSTSLGCWKRNTRYNVLLNIIGITNKHMQYHSTAKYNTSIEIKTKEFALQTLKQDSIDTQN